MHTPTPPDDWNTYWWIRIRIVDLYDSSFPDVKENVDFVWGPQRWLTQKKAPSIIGSAKLTVVNRTSIVEASELPFNQIFYTILDAIWCANRHRCLVQMQGTRFIDNEHEVFEKQSTVWDYTNWTLNNPLCKLPLK